MVFKHCPKYGDRHTDDDCKRCEYYHTQFTDDEATWLKATCEVSEYINFGDLCRGELGMQSQYGFYLLEGLAGRPSLKEGLRLKGYDEHSGNYHMILIHKDDAPIFVKRYDDYFNRGHS